MNLPIALESVGPDGGPWKANFERTWPHYKKWYLSEGHAARAGYRTCVEALRAEMPELMPIYDQLCEWAGSGDLTSRFLSMHRPPPYMRGCTQAVWDAPEGPILVRNYDYEPKRFEGRVFRTSWLKPVLGVSDCLWGVLDGMNGDGLCASLTFGGSKKVRPGFGIPLVLRYVLETCSNVEEALEVLRRIPVHMTYNVTVLDRTGDFRTLHLKAGGGYQIFHHRVCANHQIKITWPDYERVTATRARQAYLEQVLASPELSRSELLHRFLQPPLYQYGYDRSFGTLYTSVWEPRLGSLQLVWPGAQLITRVTEAASQTLSVDLPVPTEGVSAEGTPAGDV